MHVKILKLTQTSKFYDFLSEWATYVIASQSCSMSQENENCRMPLMGLSFHLSSLSMESFLKVSNFALIFTGRVQSSTFCLQYWLYLSELKKAGLGVFFSVVPLDHGWIPPMTHWAMRIYEPTVSYKTSRSKHPWLTLLLNTKICIDTVLFSSTMMMTMLLFYWRPFFSWW